MTRLHALLLAARAWLTWDRWLLAAVTVGILLAVGSLELALTAGGLP